MNATSLLRFATRRSAALAAACATLLLVAVLPAAPALAQGNADASRGNITVEASKGRLIRLDVPVKTVFIANPDVADVQVKSPKIIYLLGKKPGETTLIAVDENDRVLVNVGVTVNHNLSRLKRAIDAVLPGNRIQVRSVDGAVVLTGSANSPNDANTAYEIALRFVTKKEEIINQISMTGPSQVNLRVRVVEISRDVTKQLGINWDAVIQGSMGVVALATGAPTAAGFLTNVINGTGSPSLFNTRRLSAAGQGTVNNLGVTFRQGDVTMNALIDLLERDGLVRTLAQPNLSAMSGKSAHFLAGGEIPIPIPQSDGVITIEYKPFGVKLSFTPLIQNQNRISMRVYSEVSQLSTTGAITLQNISVPALTTRKAETMIDVASGQSFVIGGLLQNNVTRDINKIPWLSDVPVMGKLFTSESFRRNESELVIIATPYIVEPVREPTNGVPISTGPQPGAPPRAEREPAKAGAAGPPPGPAAKPGTPRKIVGNAGFQLD
jgi:pilus assembly protein CpaC